MNFYRYQTLWSLLKKIGHRGAFSSKEQFFDHYMHTAEMSGDCFAFRRAALEKSWEELQCPYYHLYPAIVPMLLRLNLDIPCSVLKSISVQPIEVRLPNTLEAPGLVWPGGRVQSLLMGLQPVPVSADAEDLTLGLVIAFDVGELDQDGHSILSFKFFPLRDDMSIEEACSLLPAHESLDIGVPIPQDTMVAVVKLCACIALIDQNSDIIAPDVRIVDKAKWGGASEDTRLAMVEAAKRRGKYGWNIGADIECIPHYRRPHPALVRVGKGRMLSRIVMRKGSVVHKSKLTTIPTGFNGE
jgi:hypothetical protein